MTETVKQQLNAALQNCKRTVFVLSPDFMSKKWPMWELQEMPEQNRSAKEKEERGPHLFSLFYKLGMGECKSEDLCESYREIVQQHEFLEGSRLLEYSREEMIPT